MSDLTERLRSLAKSNTRREEGEDWRDKIEWQAADEIDRLTRELAEARKAIKKLCDKAEEQADHLLEKWTSDLGATAETRAAGIAANNIGDFMAEIEVVLMGLEKKP